MQKVGTRNYNLILLYSPHPENLATEIEKIHKRRPLGYLYLDFQGILESYVGKSGW
jgi:hypothetical protein